MKVISVGNKYEIYDETLKVYDRLPAGSYVVRFNKMTGFYLDKFKEMEIKEDKIYGVHTKKVKKVINSFKLFDRNLGVILSGNKGIGKSLFAKLLAKNAIEEGYPLIIVDSFIPGIASYLEEIEQEVVVLFDEFDKTFGDIQVGDNETSPQASLLSLFDGVSTGKKLYVITCNNLYKLNDFLINRPGRFHYHFRFDYPSANEIKEYLMDKLQKQYYEEIDKIISFSKKVNLNYDCLRAIAFEINNGEHFEDAIRDLNIINNNDERYDITIYFENGETLVSRNENLDLFNQDSHETIYFYDKNDEYVGKLDFNIINCKYDVARGIHIIDKDNFRFVLSGDEDSNSDLINSLKETKSTMVSIIKKRDKDIHFLI